jgi:hypothetical protein
MEREYRRRLTAGERVRYAVERPLAHAAAAARRRPATP